MRNRDDVYAEILLHPESDPLRQEFASLIRSDDPEWADYITTSTSWQWQEARRPPSKTLKARLVAPFARFKDVSCHVERGFPSTAIVAPEAFLEHGEAILDLGPILEVACQITKPWAECKSWNSILPELMQCPTLRRVHAVSIWGTPDFDAVSMQHIIRSPHLERVLSLRTPPTFSEARSVPERDTEPEAEMWSLLFASPVFRGMIDWGLGMRPHSRGPIEVARRTIQCFGDSIRIEKPVSEYYELTTYDPMPPEDRALEARYGYIPRLHAGNWGATVLDVLRGTKPDFPVGARPVPEMYVVPPPTNRQVASDH